MKKVRRFDIKRFDLIIKRFIRDPSFRLFAIRRILRIWDSERILDSKYSRTDMMAETIKSEFNPQDQYEILIKWFAMNPPTIRNAFIRKLNEANDKLD